MATSWEAQRLVTMLVMLSRALTVISVEQTPVKINNNTCRHDLCETSIFSHCLNNGTCVFDSKTCSIACICQQKYTGSRCENDISNYDKVTCGPSDLTCAHGKCDNTTFAHICICDKGWSGESCDIQEHNDTKPRNLLQNWTIDNSWFKLSNNVSHSSDSEVPLSDIKRSKTVRLNNLNFSLPDLKVSKSVPLNNIQLNLSSLAPLNHSETTKSKNLSLEATEIDATQYMSVYNVCLDIYELRPLDKRQCNRFLQATPCSYGICKKELVVTGNARAYKFNCECDPGAFGTFCEKRCCLDCGIHGKCDVIDADGNLTDVCNCRYGYTGEFCEIFVPEPVRVEVHEATWYLWIVGLCAVTFVVLITAGVVAPYLMWKHRVILIMKIVHYFQPYEDDDNKEYDAFVSYKADEIDERFVVQVLYPKLEKELGFKLCLHFRDFVPGEVIANNIINAVEGSRRTILILTPRYVQSEFTKFEYQKAQAEMLKKKHRIIPIMLEDISQLKSNLDENLKGIIGSVTYLEWPDDTTESQKKTDKFWKRLQLSMPKKKDSDNIQMSSSKSNSSFPTISSSLVRSSKCVSSLPDLEDPCKGSRSPRRFVRSKPLDETSVDNILKNEYVQQCEVVEDVYVEIGDIDNSVCEMIRPMSEEDELALTTTDFSTDNIDNNNTEDHKVAGLRQSVVTSNIEKQYSLVDNDYSSC